MEELAVGAKNLWVENGSFRCNYHERSIYRLPAVKITACLIPGAYLVAVAVPFVECECTVVFVEYKSLVYVVNVEYRTVVT